MKRNKDFFVNQTSKRNKSFFVKEDTLPENKVANVKNEATVTPEDAYRRMQVKQNRENAQQIIKNEFAKEQEAKANEEAKEQERWNNLSFGEKIIDPFKTMGANIKYGNLGIEENQAWSEYRSKQDAESLAKAQQATKAREEYEASNDRIGKGNALTKDFAQYMPQLGGQLKSGLGGAAGGAGAGAVGGAGVALAAGQLGPQVMVPEEIATVPAGALTGAIWGGRGGYVAGTAKYSYDLMAGSAYKTLLDMGVPNDVALELSEDEAIINSLIEGGGAIVDLISLGIGKLGTKGATTATKKVAQNRLLAATKAYGLNLATEPLEEMAQEKVSIETEKKAADVSGIERQATEEQDAQRIKESGIGALKVSAIAGIGNAGGNIITNKVSDKIQQNQINNQIKQAEIRNDIEDYKANSQYAKYMPQNQEKGTEIAFPQKNDLRESPTNGFQDQGNETVLPTQKIQETVNSAKIAGMSDFDVKKATDLYKMLQSGANLKFYDSKNVPAGADSRATDANGFYLDGTIWLNKDSKMQVERILGHELTHYGESADFINNILDSSLFYDFINKNGFKNTAEYKQYLMDKKGYKEHELDSEMAAHFAEEVLFGNEESINRLARENKTLVQKILNWLSDLRTKLVGTAQEKELLRIENMYRKAIQQLRNSTVESNNEAKYDVKSNAEGKLYIEITTDILENIPEEQWVSKIKETFKNNLPNGIDMGIFDIAVNAKSRNEFVNSEYTKNLKAKDNFLYAEKMKMVENLDEIVRNAYNVKNEEPKHSRRDNLRSFNRGNIDVRIGDNDYTVEVVTAITSNNNEIFYDIVGIKPTKIKTSSIRRTAEADSKIEDVSNNSINQNELSVNTQYAQDEQNDTDAKYSKNPVEIAKNPPNPQNGLDALKRAGKEKVGDSQSSFMRNIHNQSIFDDTFKQMAWDDKNIRTYESISNKEIMQQANDAINEQGQKWVDRFLNKSNSEMKATDIAGGFILMNRYQQVGDYESMIRVAEKLRKAGTQQGQTIQLFSVLGRMTPEGMTFYAQKELSKAYDEILKNKTQAWADEHADDFKLNDKDIDFIQRRVNQAAKLPEGRDKYVLLGEIAARVQKKIPPQPGQGLKALARNSMLLNPKTMVRNILGNVVIVPHHIVSDFIGTGIDKAISTKTGSRTTGMFDRKSLKGAKKGLYESFDDFRRDISTRELSGDRFEIGQGGKSFNENHTGMLAIQRNALAKALNALDRVTGFLLESGDRPFYETWFINSLNNQMKLNNAVKPTAEMIQIATNEALQRTWQDNNSYTKAVSGVRNSLNKFNIKGYGLGDMVMPFVKTPANLTKAVVDFSPLGAINAALKTSQFKKDISKGQATNTQQREVVKAWSQVITGTLGMAIMTGLANAGVLGGGSDEDKDVRNFEQNILGIKPYSIKIGDKTYTYDWAQPLGTSAAIVSDMTKSLKNADSTEGKVGAVLKGLQSGASVLLEQSFVSGIRNLFEEDNLINALIETGFNEGSKFTPQFLSQIAQLQDDTARTSYVYNNIPKTALNKVKAKIPGLRQTLEPSIDVLGREVKTDNSVGNVMFNPANTAFARSTKGAEEMYRVYQATGDKATIAQVAPYYFNVGSEKVVLTPQQRTQYQKTTGRIASGGVENLLKNNAYKSLADEDKAEILKDLYSYGNAIAKAEASKKYLLSKEMQKIKDSGMKPEEYILMKYIANSGGTKKEELYNALTSNGYSNNATEKFLTDYKGYKFESTRTNTLPTLASQRAKLPTLKK